MGSAQTRAKGWMPCCCALCFWLGEQFQSPAVPIAVWTRPRHTVAKYRQVFDSGLAWFQSYQRRAEEGEGDLTTDRKQDAVVFETGRPTNTLTSSSSGAGSAHPRQETSPGPLATHVQDPLPTVHGPHLACYLHSVHCARCRILQRETPGGGSSDKNRPAERICVSARWWTIFQRPQPERLRTASSGLESGPMPKSTSVWLVWRASGEPRSSWISTNHLQHSGSSACGGRWPESAAQL
ncbi:hypothetical protein N657DRAFT_21673 [Parathielavia appendiculata]|uniref:Secreted protein n=1 Tax=Parathielavia appendiculata TaxID=2587402 RepID=A0AAN6U8H7_9PEZI|nr:hypothetical protein N657DRAFT_21673 [Parathielavia appendiculata]